MLPQNLIGPTIPAPYMEPDNEDFRLLTSLELGGVGLNDPSQGRQVQVWAAQIVGQDVRVSSENTAETTLFTVAGALSEVSLAFDSNMQPTVAFVEDGVVKLYWFDTVLGAFTTTTYPDSLSPKVATDDKRYSQSAASDVIFAYVRDSVLYWRQQRDRYTIEYAAGPVPDDMVLYRLGMNNERRFQFELREP